MTSASNAGSPWHWNTTGAPRGVRKHGRAQGATEPSAQTHTHIAGVKNWIQWLKGSSRRPEPFQQKHHLLTLTDSNTGRSRGSTARCCRSASPSSSVSRSRGPNYAEWPPDLFGSSRQARPHQSRCGTCSCGLILRQKICAPHCTAHWGHL